ncbi:MAG: T9SS type A sorting domain-containing protein [Bacteroidia bacterium]|nr:T9SS type A sorting domain-containing protein [Bacteroidia bacterium]
MQSRTNTFNPAAKAIFKLTILASLILGMITFTASQASAQMTLEWEDINFAPSTTNSTHSFLSQNKGPNISISPNPVQNYARIQKEAGTDLIKIDIVDMQGTIHFSGNFNGSFLFIPQLDAGLYSFRIYTNKGVSAELVSVS